MNNPFKYAPNPRTRRRSMHLRRFQDPIQHEKYYAYLKHRCQARYRKERYDLTWPQWQRLWTDHQWHKRGRGPRSLRLTLRNPQLGWSVKNCEIVEHAAHMSKITLARIKTRQNPQH